MVSRVPCRRHGAVIDRAVVVIPAHDERENLPRCLQAVLAAASALRAPVLIVVVLDSCTDGSAELASGYGADVCFVEVDVKNVGATRAAGFTHAREVLARDGVDESRVWYACTDADSQVDPDWLVRQIEADADMVLGVVRIANCAALLRRGGEPLLDGLSRQAPWAWRRARSRPRSEHGLSGRHLLGRRRIRAPTQR